MSDYIPFELQLEIIKKLPLKPLVQFRSVSKQWKSFIDNPDFTKDYHRHHHLLIQYKKDTFTSIIDDTNTFPQQKLPLTPPGPLALLKQKSILGSVDGLLCFYGWHQGLKQHMVVLWNPCIRKSVGIPIPDISVRDDIYTRFGFGVSRCDTNDPTLVKINVYQDRGICLGWEVKVFTLSSRVWKTVYIGEPIKKWRLNWNHVFVDGVIYWSTEHSFVISFDLKSEEFGEVVVSERAVCGHGFKVVKVDGSLGLLGLNKEGAMWVCGVWIRKDGVDKPFTNMYNIKVECRGMYEVLGFRNNGAAILELDDDHDSQVSQIEVYEPSSGCINSVGISGERHQFSAWSYMETLLLRDQSDSIIQ